MSFFAKGDFKLKDSWEQKPASRESGSRNKSRQSTEKNRSLVNVGKNIVADPSTDILDDEISRKVLKDLAYEMHPGSIKTDKKDNGPKLPPKQRANHPIASSSSGSEADLLTSMASRLKNV